MRRKYERFILARQIIEVTTGRELASAELGELHYRLAASYGIDYCADQSSHSPRQKGQVLPLHPSPITFFDGQFNFNTTRMGRRPHHPFKSRGRLRIRALKLAYAEAACKLMHDYRYLRPKRPRRVRISSKK